jgi:UDP-N-acetylmuramate dehydrogenase
MSTLLKLPNSFGVSASAKSVLLLDDRSQLKELRRCCAGQPTLVLGDGSNLLFVAPYAGSAVLNRLSGITVLEETTDACLIEAAAGVGWDELVRWSCERGYWGLENLALIPGRVGAAPIQNIGAYGAELKDCCVAVETLDEHAQLRWIAAADCQFGYRDSLFKHAGRKLWVTSLRLRLSRVPAARLGYSGLGAALANVHPDDLSPTLVAEAVRSIRRVKLPDPRLLGNAGSFFKNPQLSIATVQRLKQQWPALPTWPVDANLCKISAAWLIEQAGWKGHRAADAGVAPGHALVLVNHGQASGAQIWALAQAIMRDVHARYGVLLEPEPRVIGATSRDLGGNRMS